jgi:hypothetical protein
MFWDQFFFAHRYMSADVRAKLLEYIISPALFASGGSRSEVRTYYDKCYGRNQEYFRSKVKQYGNFWLHETEAGQAWRKQLAELDVTTGVGRSSLQVECPKSPQDLLCWQGLKGLEFTKYHASDFYMRYLVAVETEVVDPGYRGWLADDDSMFWLQNLTDVALRNILAYVVVEGPRPNTIKPQTMTKTMSSVEFPIPENMEWPEFDPAISDPSALLNDRAQHPVAFGSTNIANTVHSYCHGAACATTATPRNRVFSRL